MTTLTNEQAAARLKSMQRRAEELDWGHANLEALRMAEAALRAQWDVIKEVRERIAQQIETEMDRYAPVDVDGWAKHIRDPHPQGEEHGG